MPTPEWCDEHWMTLPCKGCRADRLAAGIERIVADQKVTLDALAASDAKDARQLAAGDN